MDRLMLSRSVKPQVGPVSFSGSLPSGREGYQALLERQKNTLARAGKEKNHIEYSSPGSSPSERQQVQAAIHEYKVNFWSSLKSILRTTSFIPAILGGTAAGYTGYRLAVNVSTAKAAVPESEIQKNAGDRAAGAGLLCFVSSTITLAFLAGGLGDNGEIVYYGEAFNALRGLFRERGRLKRLHRKTMVLDPPADALERKMVEILNQKINGLTQRFAQRFKEKYQTVPDFQKYCHDVFGDGEASLPTAKGIRELFEFFMYQHLLDSNIRGGKTSETHISETEFTKRLFSMVSIGSKMGDMFKFMAPQAGATESQVFNQALLPEIEVLDLVIQSQLDTARDLLYKEKEVEEYISMARSALAPLELGALDRNSEADELKILIREFGERQDKIHQALEVGIFKSEGYSMFLDEGLLNDMKAELSQFITRLKAVLLKDKQEDEIQAQAKRLLCDSPDLTLASQAEPQEQFLAQGDG